MVSVVAASFLAAVSTYILVPAATRMLTDSGLTRPNYEGQHIPVGMGLSFVIGTSVGMAVLLYGREIPTPSILIVWIVSLSFAFVGLIDDFAGNREVTGMKHLFSFFRDGTMTTGALKALFGGFIALVAATLTQTGFWQVVLGTLMVSLGANFVNLFDLRPGRAAKVFTVMSLLAYISSRQTGAFLSPAMAALAVYVPLDLGAKAMMGDTGANFLGSFLAVSSLLFLSPIEKAGAVFIFAAVHVYAEVSSISQLIDDVPVLRRLDLLGRRRK